MKKIFLVISIAMFTFVGKAYAEMSYGISGALTNIDASGSETEGGVRSTADAINTVLRSSIIA